MKNDNIFYLSKGFEREKFLGIYKILNLYQT